MQLTTSGPGGTVNHNITLPEEVRTAISRAAEATWSSSNEEFQEAVRACLAAGKQHSLDRHLVMDELGVAIGMATIAHTESRPMPTSWRANPYRLGIVAFTKTGTYFAYAMKPFQDGHHDYRRFRTCGEQRILMRMNDQANSLAEMEIEQLVLVGSHHVNGDELPEPCQTCLRAFTAIPNHRDIRVLRVQAHTGTRVLETLGNILKRNPPAQVACRCCSTRTPGMRERILVRSGRFVRLLMRISDD